MHDISWEDISNQYLFQMHIHNILAEEYAKEGLVYGGRTYYARYDTNTATVHGSGFVPNSTNDIYGVNHQYLPLVKRIHERV